MADETPEVQQTPATPAPQISQPAAPVPVPAPAAPSVNTPAPAPVQSNAPSPAPLDLQKGPTPPPVVEKHATLLRMIQGLSDGLSSMGTSIATKGKEGGAPMVQQLEAGRQAIKNQAQQAEQAKKTAELQNALTISDTNFKNAQIYQFLHTISSEIESSQLKVQSEKLGVIGQAQAIRKNASDDYDSGKISKTQHDQMMQQADQLSSGTSSTPAAPAAGGAAPAASAAAPATTPGTAPAASGEISPVAQSRWQAQAETASSLYPEDEDIKKNTAIVTDPNASLDAKRNASLLINTRMAAFTAGAEAQQKRTTAATETLKLDQAKAVQSVYDRQVPRNAAGQPTQDLATWQAATTKAAEQQITQGDTTELGKMAADGLITIPQIALARQLDKPGLQKLMTAANEEAKLNGMPEIIVNGRHTGNYFNVNAATQQYQYISQFNDPNSKVQQNILSNNTFLEHTADLVKIMDNYSTTNKPLFNTPLNKIKGAFGDADYTRVLAAVNPVKTEYQNALAAGFAPNAEDQKNADIIFGASSSPSMIRAAGQQMAHTVARRLEQINQGYLTHTGVGYPNILTPGGADAAQKLGLDTSTLQSGGSFAGVPQVVNPGTTSSSAPAGAAIGTIHKNLSDFSHQATGAKGTIYSDDGKTWYDANGKLIPGK